jgi:DNA polymerase I-like protein with 3'-5' exonuclease and polymerase domains
LGNCRIDCVLVFAVPSWLFSCSVAAWLQVELRVVAALAGEAALHEAFAAGRDVHEATARVLLDKQPGVSCSMLLRHSSL